MNNGKSIFSTEINFSFLLMAVGLYGLVIPKAIFQTVGIQLGAISYAVQWVCTVVGFLLYISPRWKNALSFNIDINDYFIFFLYGMSFIFGFVYGMPEFYFWVKILGWLSLGMTQYFIARIMTDDCKAFEKLFLGVFLLGIILLLSSFIIAPHAKHEFQRFTVTGSVPISYARMLGILVIVCVWLVDKKPNLASITFCIITSFCALVFMLKTGTRGALLAMIFSSFIYLLLVRRSVIVKFIFASFGAVAAPFLIEKYGSFILFRFKQLSFFFQSNLSIPIFEASASASWRIFYWKTALERIINSPFIGIGTGRFHELVPLYFASLEDLNAHNIFFELGSELGIWAIAVVLIMVTITFKRCFALITKIYFGKVNTEFDRSVVLLITIIFIYILVDSQTSGDLSANYLLWFCIGAITSLYQNAQQKGYL